MFCFLVLGAALPSTINGGSILIYFYHALLSFLFIINCQTILATGDSVTLSNNVWIMSHCMWLEFEHTRCRMMDAIRMLMGVCFLTLSRNRTMQANQPTIHFAICRGMLRQGFPKTFKESWLNMMGVGQTVILAHNY
jgi:hypothetical protein